MATIEALRANIDAERTREKVRGSDPSAAPLGADEEAAGTPISPTQVMLACDHEVDAPTSPQEQGGIRFYLITLATIAVLLVSAILYLRG